MRKSAAERVAEYKTKAAEIERREQRKLRAKSPQWVAVRRALRAFADAGEAMASSDDEADHALLIAVANASDILRAVEDAQVTL